MVSEAPLPVPTRRCYRTHKINQGAARTPFTPVCSRAFRTTPVFFASLTISTTLACAADDRPFGSMTIVRSLVKAPGTIFAPGSPLAARSIALALPAQTSTRPVRNASIELTPGRTSSADFNVRLRNWSDELLRPTPILTPGAELERRRQTGVRAQLETESQSTAHPR